MKERLSKTYSKYSLETIFIALCLILSLTAPNFATVGNAVNILRNASIRGILAWGLTVIIVGGGIDLSVGAMVGLSGVLVGTITQAFGGSTAGVLVGFAVALIVGCLGGMLNAFFITKFKMPGFIVTLGTSYIFQGFAGIISKGYPVMGFPEWYRKIAGAEILGIPILIFYFLILFAVFYILLNHTRYGRYLYACGGNREAARLSGINVVKVQYIQQMLSQICAVISGVLMTSQVMSGKATFGNNWALEGIAAVMIGGSSISGGSGKMWGTLIGVLIMNVINNAMTLFNLGEYWQLFVKGVVLMIAVMVNTSKNLRRTAKRSA